MPPVASPPSSVLLPGPTAPLPGWLTGVLLAVLLAVALAAAVAVIVIVTDVRVRTATRRGTRRRPDPPGERPRETVGPTGELIELDEARHRLMELR